MKKSTIIIGLLILAVGLYFYTKNQRNAYTKATIKTGDAVAGIYTGSQKILGTNQYLANGDPIKGTMNADGSVKYTYVTSYGTKSINIPASQIKNLKIA